VTRVLAFFLVLSIVGASWVYQNSEVQNHELPVKTVLDFWFSDEHEPDYGKARPFWFHATPEIDVEIGTRLGELYQKTKRGQLDHLKQNAKGLLTLIILLDQIPRHLFRGQKEAFATDQQALAFAKEGVLKGFDQELPDFMRMFFYLPFEHSENLENQQQSVRLFEALGNDLYLKYALEHYEVIQEFGRFPYRNQALQRPDTEEETMFLHQ